MSSSQASIASSHPASSNMAAAFDSAHSTNKTLSSTQTPSMADTLPSINFGFDDLRDRMARFTDRFDEFIAKGRKHVLEERNQFRINMAELHESQRQKHKSLDLLNQKASTHSSSLAKEAAETAEIHADIQSITTQHSARLAHRDALRAQINQVAKQVAQRVAAQQQHAQAQEAQARLNAPELVFWEAHLCLRIEGAGKGDRLRFVFSHLDERNWEREAWFELDTARRDYKVVGSRPKLDGDVVEPCVEWLNENRELGQFLRGMRELLVKAMK